MKKSDCRHQFENEPECQPAFKNIYECDNCGTTWEDIWSCGCDDECPSCGLDISPTDSEEIAPCACKELLS